MISRALVVFQDGARLSGLSRGLAGGDHVLYRYVVGHVAAGRHDEIAAAAGVDDVDDRLHVVAWLPKSMTTVSWMLPPRQTL